MILRVRKEDSAYVYQVIESYEGITNHSTLSDLKSVPYRDVVLHIAPDLKPYVEKMVAALAAEIPVEILPAPSKE